MSELDYKLWFIRNSGWMLIIVFTLFPMIVWLSAHPPVFADTYDVFSTIGKALGIAGFMLYAINLILAARVRWLEPPFGGLNRVYIAHHLTGGIALALLVFHPLFLAIRQIELTTLTTLQDAAKELLPRGIDFSVTFPEVLDDVAYNAGIIAFIGMVVLLVITFYVHLPYRIWLYTHRFLGVAFLFAGFHVLFIPSDISRSPILFWYIALFTVLGITAFIYRTIMGNVFVRRVPYKVEIVQTIAGNTIAVEMSPIEKRLDFKPGQFVFVRFIWANKDGIINEVHPFSIASAPSEPHLRLYMKALGDFTGSLKHLKPGTIAEIEGAYGKFSYSQFGDTPQIWIAGGIGITPFLSMARSYDRESPPVHLFYSVVHKEELLDQMALRDYLPVHYPSFIYHPYVADEQKEFLNVKYIAEQVGGVGNKEIFICGPPPMMKALRTQFKELGVPNRKIHSEEFSMQ